MLECFHFGCGYVILASLCEPLVSWDERSVVLTEINEDLVGMIWWKVHIPLPRGWGANDEANWEALSQITNLLTTSKLTDPMKGVKRQIEKFISFNENHWYSSQRIWHMISNEHQQWSVAICPGDRPFSREVQAGGQTLPAMWSAAFWCLQAAHAKLTHKW